MNTIAIKSLIDSQDYVRARSLLNNIQHKTSMWYYLSSLIDYKKCWFDSALKNINTAIKMDNTNEMYNSFKAKLTNRPNNYSRDYYNSPRYRQNQGCCCDCCDCCDCCGCRLSCCDLICLDTCCECMGGDLIKCI
ncbi:MAG: hypothetical protein BEN19_08025 [Epulopiscium sp. Nuni2H_MBin003]|nr:MAG: hypothetical protein BEN19_08025 [Epulopiscium sp. Nuni2H_MBin003]